MKKGMIVGAVVVIVSLLGYGIYTVNTLSLFDVEITHLKTINVPEKPYTLKVYLLPSNSTSQSYIQVRKIESKVEEVLASYERYNYLNSYTLSDGEVSFILSDTSIAHSRADTVRLTLP
jgi:hypothetical protein